MPELPEVEVIRRGLEPLIRGRRFAKPELLFPGAVRYPSPEDFRRRLARRRVAGLERKGKYLLVRLERGELVAHLRMTGRLIYREQGAIADPHLRAALPFEGGGALFFSDMRKFGGLWLLDNKAERSFTGMHRLGPDILEEVDRARFLSLVRKRPRARIKPLLLDQHFLAGLGNIYVDESLFHSGIHPCREAASLTREEIIGLYRSVRAVLEEGIRYGGTSSRDYRDARGEQGVYQHRLAVYGRKGLSCRCGAEIRRIVVAGRGTYYCPQCQRQPEPVDGSREQ